MTTRKEYEAAMQVAAEAEAELKNAASALNDPFACFAERSEMRPELVGYYDKMMAARAHAKEVYSLIPPTWPRPAQTEA